jgi:hypothetical protein
MNQTFVTATLQFGKDIVNRARNLPSILFGDPNLSGAAVKCKVEDGIVAMSVLSPLPEIEDQLTTRGDVPVNVGNLERRLPKQFQDGLNGVSLLQ